MEVSLVYSFENRNLFQDEAAKGNAHAGGVYGLAWSPNGQEILTASGKLQDFCSFENEGQKSYM